jgi:multiple sugar transport system ATP-binding protein
MAQVEYRKATRIYPGTTIAAVKALDLDIQDGEFMVLVGPSGSGKSTALRMLAGLEAVDEGQILIGDRDVTDVQPKDRDIAMVFQNYALYPHMTVAENIGFHLKIKKRPKAEIKERVLEAAKLLDLEPYLDRKPARLSGGQRQRVAMGRAIVRQPQVLRHPRPGRGHDDGRPRRGTQGRRPPAVRHPAHPVRPSGQHVRRRLHR